MKIGNNIKLYRNKKGLTQKQLAEKIGTTDSAITRYESNSREPSIEIITKIAKALNISINELLDDKVVSNDIGSKIISAKIFRKLDDEQLSKLTGIDELQLRAIQDGKINPTKSELDIITKALNLSVGYFEKDSPLNTDKDGNIEDKYNIDELQIRFGLNRTNMTHEELCALIYFYQNQNFNLSKKVKEISKIINEEY